jgi:putative phage-type endonuclease
MQQNSAQWFDWRNKGIGSSDTPIIMGISPFKTPYELWEEKVGVTPRDTEGNFATRQGHNMEGVAREHWELKHNMAAPPQNFTHKSISFLKASLDGWNEKNKLVLEIKCPGKKAQMLAEAGQIPHHYFYQIQHQLLVTGGKIAHYWSFDSEKGVCIPVQPDAKAQERVVTEASAFWKLIKSQVPPPLGDRDYKIIKDETLLDLMQEYADIKTEYEKLNQELKDLRELIVESMDHSRIKGSGLTIYKAFRKGNIDYRSIPELKTVDLEKYRKIGTRTVTIKSK